ncbi:MAG: hypothetical protein OXH09_15305 [Gammaproteobacteria bacterium]|nr:hypothetical protein [Gammaproteobacteria bacterium]
MRNERDARTFRLRRVARSAWLAIAIVGVTGLLATWWFVGDEPVSTVATDTRGASGTSMTDTLADDASPDVPSTGQMRAAGAPTAEAVLADPHCRMVVGQRTASDTALVYLPLGDGAWFAVVNTFGVVFDGTLPFIPERPAIGKRPDGTILAGFGLEGEVQVVHDGSVIYEFDDVWAFDIAHDGSSFFVVEPLAGDASRLVVQNLELREEHHFDLGTIITRTNRSLDFGVAYSMDRAEVIVQPSRGGTSRFFPTAGGAPREVFVEHKPQGTFASRGILASGPKVLSIFATSELSYHARKVDGETRRQDDRLWVVVRVERDFGIGAGSSRQVWMRNLEFFPLVSMQLSPSGGWLLVSDPLTGIEVLDTTDGQTVFSYPPRRDIRLTMLRYSRRPPGELLSGRFVGERLFVRRHSEDKAGTEDQAWYVEVFELDRFAKTARKVREFAVEPGAAETERSFAIRTSLDPDAPTSCKDHALLDRRLVVRDGRLVYWASNY